MSFLLVALLLLSQAPVSTARETPAELSVQAGVVLRNGEIRKVARTPLVLLNADFASRLLEVYSKGVRDAGLQGGLYMATKHLIAMGQRPGSEPEKKVQQMDDFVKTHTVATAITDFDGKATIQAPPGDYCLYAYFETGLALWSVPVTIRTGKNEIILDHNNTAK
jgi:hypothetical protein